MSSWGAPLIVVVFAAAGVATWIAGLYLSKATDVLDARFRLATPSAGCCSSDWRAHSLSSRSCPLPH